MGKASQFIKKLLLQGLLSLLFLVFIFSIAKAQTADLVVGLTSNVSVAKVNDTVVFTVTIKNNGPFAATNTRVTDVLPSGYTFVNATPSIGVFANPIWTVGTLAVNETATISITAKVNSFGSYTNTVAIKASEPDANLVDNSAKTSLSIIRAIDDYAYVNENVAGAVIGNILANDFLNGSFADIIKLNLLQVSSSNPDLNLDASTGKIVLTNPLPTGNYTLVYKITDKVNTASFATGTVFINSNASNGGNIDAPILANHDAGQAPEITGGIAVFNILANDKLAGQAASLSNVDLTFVSSTDARITLDPATANVLVALNTPGGPYILNYKITSKTDATVTASSYVTVNVIGAGSLDTKDDAGAVNGATGGIAVTNVLDNDLFKGSVININDVNLTQLFSNNPGITLNVNTGEVTVAPNTPNGFFTLTYQVIDKLDAANKGAADVIITITGGAIVITAKEDRGLANGTSGGIAVNNILANDEFMGAVPKISDVYISQLFSNNSAINIDFNTGQVIVNPGSRNGFYTLTYQIQDKINPVNISFADIIIEIDGGLSLLTAKEDAGSASGVVGGVAVANVLANDDLAGIVPTLTQVSLQQTFSNNLGVNLDTNTGQVIVDAGTENGVYTVAYYIEDKSKPESSSYADVIVRVTQDNINLLANPDAGTTNGITGGVAIINVLANDVLSGKKPLITEVNLTQISTDNAGVNLELATGKVVVSVGTSNGIYTLKYQIENIANLGETSIADVTVTVNSGVATINAVQDNGIVNNITGGIAVVNVLKNDLLNGKTPVIGEVNISQLYSSDVAFFNIDASTGKVIVNPNAPIGFYTVTYQIADKLNPGITSIADVVIEVTVDENKIVANDDTGQISGLSGGTAVEDVLNNDLIKGATATLTEVLLEQVSASNPNIFLQITTGKVLVASGMPPGDYVLNYKITDKLDATKFSTANVYVSVVLLSPLAKDDAGAINGFFGGVAVNNVLFNDLFKNLPVNSNDVLLSLETSSSPNVSLNIGSGSVNVSPGTGAGDYVLTYKIADKLNAGNFSIATVRVKVTPPPISATDDAGTINGFTGGTAVNNILANDAFNGSTALPANVSISQTTVNPNIIIDPLSGKVTVASNTPAGVYNIDYKITDKINPLNTATAKIVITVSVPVITAMDDAGTINGFTGGTVVNNVLANDSFNGTTALLANATISQLTFTGNLTIDPQTGKVIAAPNTPAGIYAINYKITDKINSTNTVTAKVVVTVSTPVIIATEDAGTINGFTGGTAVNNILVNDTFNGTTALLSNVTISQITVNPNITINQLTGRVNVAPNTPAGVYNIDYKITDKINPSNIATAKVVVTVSATAITAIDDAGTINGFIGGTAVNNILANDLFNGATALVANVIISQTTVNPNIIIDPLTGKVTVAPNTPANIYNISYKITDKINPTNVATATIVITVKPQSVLAIDDEKTVEGAGDVVAIANIIANDLRNDAPTDLSKVNIINIVNANPNILVDVLTGSVTVKKEALAGIYVLNYTIQDKGNNSLTSIAKIAITIKAKPVLGIAKSVTIPKKEIDGSYTFTYNLTAKNYGNTELTTVSLVDDLSAAFPSPVDFTVLGNVETTGTLTANPLFNGKTVNDLLMPTSILQPNQTEKISFTINVRLNNTTNNTFNNMASGSANSAGGIVRDNSTNGIDPDPNNDNDPQEFFVTPIILDKAPIRIPQGFSPNNDGVHDKFLIENTAGDVIILEVFNRWGNVVYKNIDYKNDWTGQSNEGITIGQDLPDGTYYYIVKVNGKDKYVKYFTIKR